MATFYQDIIEYLTDYIDDYANLDSTALDVIIYDFLMTKENGYAEEYLDYYDEDSTAYVRILIDTTAPTTTVLEWKEESYGVDPSQENKK